MTKPNRSGAQAPTGFHEIAEAERLLQRAEQEPSLAREAAINALRGLLLYWGEEPRGQTVSELLQQTARTDGTLADFMVPASDLDAKPGELDGYERAKKFVDAARARLTGD
jgi:hypothetical protein